MDFQTYCDQYLSKTDKGSLCLLCCKTIVRQRNVRLHFLDSHQATQAFKCPACLKSYRTKNSFRVHVYRIHKDWKGVDYEKFKEK